MLGLLPAPAGAILEHCNMKLTVTPFRREVVEPPGVPGEDGNQAIQDMVAWIKRAQEITEGDEVEA